MKKLSIKIIKRSTKDAPRQTEPKIFDDSLETARKAKREMVKTVTGWIDEQREQNRLAEIIARQMIST